MSRSWAEIRAERREAERQRYAAECPEITRELIEQRVVAAEAAGVTLIDFVVFLGAPPKPRANNPDKCVRLPVHRSPRSNPDSRLEALGYYIYRAWWMVSDLRTWLRKTRHET